MRHIGLAFGVAMMLAACAIEPPPTSGLTPPSPIPAPAPPPQQTVRSPIAPTPAPVTDAGGNDFIAPPGWGAEDHVAAINAFVAGCGAATEPALAATCNRARALSTQTAASARHFLETNFQAHALEGKGLLTAYFAPEYEARASREGDYTAAVLGRPDDLQVRESRPVDPATKGASIVGQLTPRGFVPYPPRAAIEARLPDRPLAWMKPEDLFFLQIQGSGVLILPDGRRVKVLYAANNGLPFLGIANPMRERKLLAADNTSAEVIRAWLAANRGPAADEIMRLNPRYVFFRTVPDDGFAPAGAAGVPLPAGRAIAVDIGYHGLGALYWIDASVPTLTGAFPAYRRAVMALDTGGAIQGDIRADLYLGAGDAAGREAGRVRHTLTLWRLDPRR